MSDAGGPDGGALGGYAGETPPEAGRRLRAGAFSSGLSVNDFAACLRMGLRPVALVQGFCAMQWSWYSMNSPYAYSSVAGRGALGGGGLGGGLFGGTLGNMGGTPGTVGGGFGGAFNTGGYAAGGGRYGGYQGNYWGTQLSSYNCPHGFAYYGDEHRIFGENFEQPWKTQAWATGFNTAYKRMVDEAREAGAHGIIGIVDTTNTLTDNSIHEFHVYGTAVVAEGQPPANGQEPWTTYLAGQRLAKLLEAGLVPVSLVASMASVRIWAVCVTEMMMHGSAMAGSYAGAGEITQISDAQMQVRDLARDHVKTTLGADGLHGADLDVTWHDVAEGDFEVEAILRGTRVHRARDAEPLPPPELIVRMS